MVRRTFLLSQLEKHDPHVVFFDKDRGADLYVRAAGGTWKRCDGDLGVSLPEGNWTFPFAKVEKLLRGEDGQSLLGFFEVALALPQLMRQTLDKKELK